MRNSYLIAGINIPRLLKLLRRNPISCQPKYILRILFLFQSAFWSTVFGVIENRRFRKKIEASPKPKAPIFIIGHWRTGSTLLHQIMNLDPGMVAPTLFQVAEPDCFLTTYRYYQPIMKLLLRKSRPMDQVKLGMDEPQEDEYAIFRLTDHSPLERLVFPRNSKFFLQDCPSFVPEDGEKAEWERQILFFYKKLVFEKQKTLISKNPFHSLRIKELLTLFPDARFIHIYRHPCDVVPSTMHLWKIVQKQNALNNNGRLPELDEVVSYLDHFWTIIQKDFSLVAKENRYEIKFEELEKDPHRVITDLYTHLQIPFSKVFEANIVQFSNEIKQYQKNQYQVSSEHRNLIRSKLERHMKVFDYQ